MQVFFPGLKESNSIAVSHQWEKIKLNEGVFQDLSEKKFNLIHTGILKFISTTCVCVCTCMHVHTHTPPLQFWFFLGQKYNSFLLLKSVMLAGKAICAQK